MKKLFALLALLTSPIWAAYAYVTGYDATDINSTTTVPISSVTYASGETAFLAATYGCSGRITESVADGTNAYTYIGTQYDATNGQCIAAFVLKNATAGTYTVTLTLASAATFKGLAIRRYTGLDNAGTPQFVGNAQNGVATTADAITSGNITPAGQPAILWSFTMETTGGGSTPTAGTGFTSRGAFTTWNTVISATMSEDQRLTATTPVAATYTASTSTNTYTTAAVVYPEPGAGGSGGAGGYRSLLHVGK